MNAQSKLSGYQRRLSAILYADVHEFSRMMMSGDIRTIAQLKSYRSIISDITRNNFGNTITATGDSVVASFQSAQDAVNCAVDIQKEIQNQNRGLPAFRRMSFRIAVNLGEILVDEDNIFGDGVYIAARIQKLARPGGICLSGAVYDAIKAKLDLEFTFLGQQSIKNVMDSVTVYRIKLAGETASTATDKPAALERAHVAIALLPLDNLSGSKVFDPVVSILRDDVSMALSKFREVSVVASESAFLFKSDVALLQKTSQDLNISYIFSGSIRQVSGSARLVLQLLNARKGGEVIWGEQIDRDIDELNTSLDDIVRHVVSTIVVLVEKLEQEYANVLDTTDINAYQLLLNGQRFASEFTARSNHAARRLYEAAIRQDPNYARAYAELSRTHNFDWRYSWSESPERSMETALTLAKKAVQIDELNARSLAELGFVYLVLREHDTAIAQYERARQLNPNDTEVMADMADALAYAGRGEEAIDLLQTSLKLNPYDPDWRLWSLGDTYYMVRDYEAVIKTMRTMRDPAEGHRLMAASYAQLGMIEEAQRHATEVLQRQPDFSAQRWANIQPELNPDETLHYLEGLQKAGL